MIQFFYTKIGLSSGPNFFSLRKMDLILRLEAISNTGKDSGAAKDVATSQSAEFQPLDPFLPQEHAKGGLWTPSVRLGNGLFRLGASVFGHRTSKFRHGTYLFRDGPYLFRHGKYLFDDEQNLFRHGKYLFDDGPGIWGGENTFSVTDNTFSVTDNTFSITDNTFSITDNTFSVTDLTSSMAGFLGSTGVQTRPQPSPTASRPEHEASEAQAWISAPEGSFSWRVPTPPANPNIRPTWHRPESLGTELTHKASLCGGIPV